MIQCWKGIVQDMFIKKDQKKRVWVGKVEITLREVVLNIKQEYKPLLSHLQD